MRLLKDHYQKAQARMKQYADQNRTESKFKVGDLALLKLQPYRQTSVRGAAPEKLFARFFGLYQVLERIGKVAYKLELPLNSKIHNVFHVSLLKKIVGGDFPSSEEVPYMWEFEEKQPEAILERRMVKRHNREVSQVLVKWKGADVADARWED